MLKSKQNKIRGTKPQTRKAIPIAAKKVAKFVPGEGLKEKVK